MANMSLIKNPMPTQEPIYAQAAQEVDDLPF